MSFIESALLTMLTAIAACPTNAVHEVIENGSLFSANSSSLFSYVGGSATHIKIMDTSDGYAYYENKTYRCPYTENSDLYILHRHVEFTPGCIAHQIYPSDYAERAKLGHFYVSTKVQRHLNGGVHGGDIAVKSYWPQSSPFTTTITSSFGGSISPAFSYALSASGGIDLSGNANASVSVQGSSSVSFTFSWQNSISTSSSDPTLSTQWLPDDPNGVFWYYNILEPNGAGSVTQRADCYLLFEMNKSYVGCGRDAYESDFSTSVTYAFWYSGWFSGWRDGSTESYNLHIYSFC